VFLLPTVQQLNFRVTVQPNYQWMCVRAAMPAISQKWLI